ncbi:hypothetical protein GA830_16285 [Mesorhizobium sp. NBSH29]|uniref:NUDIX hydrolase n=1 Tax=Mesorhizobium sp. NBSH29 TaxID=2654249 RepID=UPI0018966E1F|nr:NUDIX hydrolase [Mesorhizobium sp. NBSH29]QPC88135.1 hypothetical protein GA830_16285 [Mesorhizobium sp. NBSH29]
MAFDLPKKVVFPVETVDVRLDPGPHPFETAHGAEIDQNWLHEKAANPTIFDGQVVLLAGLGRSGRSLTGCCHAIRFATFLYWRRKSDHVGTGHAYAHAALVTRDNALVAIRMAKTTSNPGQVYFAAGSFEPGDFHDGQVDLHHNMAREVREETGININGLRRDRLDHAFSDNIGTVLFRRYYLAEDAETVAARVRAFVAGDPEPEIEEPVIIRRPDDLPQGLKAHMSAIIDWHFLESPPFP